MLSFLYGEPLSWLHIDLPLPSLRELSRGAKTLPGPCQMSWSPHCLFLLVVQDLWADCPLCSIPRKHMALPFKETCLYLSSTSEHGSLPASISPATRSVALVHPLGPLLGYTIVCAPLGPCHTPPSTCGNSRCQAICRAKAEVSLRSVLPSMKSGMCCPRRPSTPRVAPRHRKHTHC